MLHELKLLQCKMLQSRALHALLPVTGMGTLVNARVLDLSYCHLPTSAAIAALLLNCRQFKARNSPTAFLSSCSTASSSSHGVSLTAF